MPNLAAKPAHVPAPSIPTATAGRNAASRLAAQAALVAVVADAEGSVVEDTVAVADITDITSELLKRSDANARIKSKE